MKEDPQKIEVFLLGGYDLEMMEIKKLLKENGRKYSDLFLQWDNAQLSKYNDELAEYGNKDNYIIYGIELHEKGAGPLPSNYRRIDHHNNYSHFPSSLEQICDMFGIPMDRYLQLVAVNDKAYIPGLMRMGATPNEIRYIRLRDRKAQGITPKEEKRAIQSIQSLRNEKGLLIVRSESSRFSPIVDRLFPYHHLLIYTDDELMFYGKGKDLLATHFCSQVKEGKMFHGGDANGFIGTTRGVYSEEELEELIKIIQEIVSNS